MRPPSGERLEALHELMLDHSWTCPGGMPRWTLEQLAEWASVSASWFREEFAPAKRLPSVPKEHKPARPKRNTDPPASVVKLVKRRATNDDGLQLCEVCGDALGVNTHHRQARGMGGSREEHINTASNLLWVCGWGNSMPGCHADIENGRKYAKAVGWLVPRPTLPIEVPVLRRGVLVYLDDKGGLEVAEGKVA